MPFLFKVQIKTFLNSEIYSTVNFFIVGAFGDAFNVHGFPLWNVVNSR